MTITGKEMNHGEKPPQVYVKPKGIYIDRKGFRHLPPATRQDNDRYRRTYSENSVPCHHPQQKGLCIIDPHHAAEGNQKIHPFG